MAQVYREGKMSEARSLPDWIKEIKDDLSDVTSKDAEQLIEALAVAWEVLNKFANEDYRGNRPNHCTEAFEAMRCIEEISK